MISAKPFAFAAALALLVVLGAAWLARRGESPVRLETTAGAEESRQAGARLESAARANGEPQRRSSASHEASGDEAAGPPIAAERPLASATLRVHVHSAVDRAPVGANVAIRTAPPGVSAPVATERVDGAWLARVPAGRVLDVYVGAGPDWHESFAQVDALAPGEQRVLHVSVTAATERVFVGRVVRAEDGAPIEGARVTPNASRTWRRVPPEEHRPATTDAGGYFTVRMSSKTYGVLRVEAPGRSPRFVDVDGRHPTRESAREISLDRACELFLRVVDERASATESLIARIEISRSQAPHAPRAPFLRATALAEIETDGVEVDGGFAFPRAPTGVPLEVTLRRADWKTLYRRLVILEAGERRELVARIRRGGRVVGSVLDQHGEPVRHQRVRLALFADPRPCRAWSGDHPAHVTATDDRGRFVLEGVAPGSWILGLHDPDTHIASTVHVVEVPEGVREQTVELQVDRGLSLEGLVLDARGEPAASRDVRARGSPGECALEAVTDGDGRFRIAPVPMDVYHLTACEHQSHSCSDEVSAVPGESIVLRLNEGGGLLVSAHDGTTGEPRPVDVRLTSAGGTRGVYSTQISAPERILDGLKPGRYDVFVQAWNGDLGLAAGVVVQAGHRLPVDILLHPGAHLEVRCGRERPLLVRVLHSGAQMAEGTCSSDHAAHAVVPAGDVVVQAFESPTRMLVERVVRVEAGSVTSLDLDE